MLINPPIDCVLEEGHVSPVTQYLFYNSAPLGILYIASMLEENGHEVAVIDAAAELLNVESTTKRVQDWNPDVIGQRLVQTVLDDVLPQGIDLEVTGEVEIPPLSDGWSPAEFELPSGRLIPESQPQSAQGPQKVAPIISARIDERFSDAESELHRRRFALHEIERELETIQSRMAESTPADIVGLTDRLLALEGQLEAISETPLGEDLGPITPFDPGVIEVEVNYPILRPVSGQVPHLEKAREKHGTAVLRKRKVKVPV